MAVEVNYITTATNTFLDLQSGLARPYWEVNITVSGDASTTSGTVGQAYSSNNDIISMGMIDRAKPVLISGLSQIFAGSLTLTLNNVCGTYSPLATASIFTDAGGSARDYLHSTINIWAGFENISGTAFVLQRGSFLLTKLRIESEDNLVYLMCEDAAKIPLSHYAGLPDISGTSTTWTPTSGTLAGNIITELLSGVGLTAGQWSVENGLNFPNFAITEENVGQAIADLAQASEGFVYTNGEGKVVFNVDAPSFGGLQGVGDVALELKDTKNANIAHLRYSIDINNLINKVQINYTTGGDSSRSSEDTTVTKGRPQIITNEKIDRASIANSLSSRLLGRYKEYKPYVEIDSVYLPSLEINDVIEIYDTNTYQTAVPYEIYRIREDILNCKTKIYAVYDNEIKFKWGFCSDTSATNPSTPNSGGSDFTAAWSSGFAFVGYDSGTAVNPGFDAEGDNDNNMESGVTSSGAGGTGIELPFLVY